MICSASSCRLRLGIIYESHKRSTRGWRSSEDLFLKGTPGTPDRCAPTPWLPLSEFWVALEAQADQEEVLGKENEKWWMRNLIANSTLPLYGRKGTTTKPL